MASHFDYDFDVLRPAAQRYQERTPDREENRRKLRSGRKVEADSPERVQARMERLAMAAAKEATAAPLRAARVGSSGLPALVETIGFERVIGRTDFQGMNFLEMALAVGRVVCRVQVKGSPTSLQGYGTGFLVSPRLLLTNNHVFRSEAEARYSLAEFDYQQDKHGAMLPVATFELAPDEFFATNVALDFSLVAVKPVSRNGVALTTYGWTRLIATQGKAILGDPLNVIQHPKGEPKQVVLRSNTLVDLMPDHAHYESDTERGSSGSPVFNDQWEVVALHHAGVPAKEGDDLIAIDGRVWTPAMGPERLRWVANEGIRVSSIVKAIEDLRFQDPVRGRLRDDLLTKAPPHPLEVNGGSATAPPSSPAPYRTDDPASATTWTIPLHVTVRIGAPTPGGESVGALPPERPALPLTTVPADAGGASDADIEAISIDPDYSTRQGYAPDFLGKNDKSVPLPKLPAALLAKAARNQQAGQGEDPNVLEYHHFSLVQHRARRLAIYTAVNIDGKSHKSPSRETDKWFYDPRIAKAEQMGNEVYASNPLDRGHLVRRLDPAWGSSMQVAKVANDDTFHWTNCSPQEARFNQGQSLWAGLEDYILKNAVNADMKVSVFTGPVFRKTDPRYRGIQIPIEYWKVAVIAKQNGALSATAYVVSQEDQIGDLPEEDFVYGRYRTFQVPVKRIEKLTGISFGKLAKFDPLAAAPGANEAALEDGKVGVHELVTANDIRL